VHAAGDDVPVEIQQLVVGDAARGFAFKGGGLENPVLDPQFCSEAGDNARAGIPFMRIRCDRR
jgi:hypothetical protein